VVDSYPYGALNGWLSGPPTCAADVRFSLTERSRTLSSLVSTLSVLEGSASGDITIGDLTGTINISPLKLVTVTSGAFANTGFGEGNWTANVGGTEYTGTWQGAVSFDPDTRVYDLKGTVSGDLIGISAGALTESVLGSGVYDHLEFAWTLTPTATATISGVFATTGTSQLAGTSMRVYQSMLTGSATGFYSGPLSMTMTRVTVTTQSSPYKGRGFGTLQYTADWGSETVPIAVDAASDGNVPLTAALFGSLQGPLLAVYQENDSPPTLEGSVQRVEVGALDEPVLFVSQSAPRAASPGQTITYTIAYGNDGWSTASDVLLRFTLPPASRLLFAAPAGFVQDDSRELRWTIDSLPGKSSGSATVQAVIDWGLDQDRRLESLVEIGRGSPPLTETYTPQPAFSQTPDLQSQAAGFGVLAATLAPTLVCSEATQVLPSGFRVPFAGRAWATTYAGHGQALDFRVRDPETERGTAWEREDANIENTEIIRASADGIVIQSLEEEEEGRPECRFNPNRRQTYGKVVVIEHTLRDGQIIAARDHLPGDQRYTTRYAHLSHWDVTLGQEVRWGERIGLIGETGCSSAGVEHLHFEVNAGGCFCPKERIPSTPPSTPPPACPDIYEQTGVDIGGDDGEFGNATDCPRDPLCAQEPQLLCIVSDAKMSGINEVGDGTTCRASDGTTVYYGDADGASRVAAGFEGDTHDLVLQLPRDPNAKSVLPSRYATPGQQLRFTVQYENEGEGSAYGVYVTDVLDEQLDDSTLDLLENGFYDPATRTITWLVGEVGPHIGGGEDFTVNVGHDVEPGAIISNSATVYFASISEVTPTNPVSVTIVGSTSDIDGDGVLDLSDNCPTSDNPGQEDSDSNGEGDACDPGGAEDSDTDGFRDNVDVCPFVVDPGQENADGDLWGNVCDEDDDEDFVLDSSDSCSLMFNPNQVSNDGQRRPNGSQIPGEWASNPTQDNPSQACVDLGDQDDDNDASADVDESNASCPYRLVGDSDGDRIMDGYEVSHGANPCDEADRPVCSDSTDTDGDGFTDCIEQAGYNTCASFNDTVPGWTNCSNPIDSDSDGCADWIEIVDLNGNRLADILDVLFVAKRGLGLNPPSDSDGVLDMNKNGSVDSLDALIAAKNSNLVKSHSQCTPEG
jgi:uncharacterized repeat protein (TIGR01451 family)